MDTTPVDNFKSLDLDPILMDSLERMEYSKPTPIQAKAIPLALAGRDIMGSAQTGTGKTAAFSIPLMQKLITDPNGTALVMTPTRELGKQIMDIMHQLLGRNSGINTAFIIGGEPIGKQFAQLRRRPRLIVGTPGRINDHLERGTLDLEQTKFLVLDETDRMLDMGFSIQLDRIAKYLPNERQTMMFSATLPDNILSLAKKYLTNPERICVGSNNTPVENIQQDIVHVTDGNKYDELTRELEEREGSVIIFAKTKHGTDRLAKRLNGSGFRADAIHGDLKQGRRSRVIKDFREQKFRVLVATDVVARGLDIPHIEHVVNYDLPQVPEDYIHRIGRTARAGAKGHALCLISPQERKKWVAIERLIDPNSSTSSGSVRPNSRSKARSEERTNGAFGRKKFGQKKLFKSGKPRYENGEERKQDKSFKKSRPQRDDEARRDDRPFKGDRPQRSNDNRGGDKSFRNDRPRRDNDSRGDSRGGDKPYRNDKPRRDNDNRGENRGGDKPYRSDKPRRSEEGRRNDKPFRSDKPRRDNDSRGDNRGGDKPRNHSGGKPGFKGKSSSGKGNFSGGYRKRKAA